MPIPDYQSLMLPLLRRLGDGAEHSLSDLTTHLAEEFGLTDAERKELLPSGQQPVFDNRVGWAKTYMKKARLLESPRRGWVCITPRGLVGSLTRASSRHAALAPRATPTPSVRPAESWPRIGRR